MDRLLDEQPRAGAAALALIEKQAELGPGDGRVEVGVGEDHVRAFATQLKRQSLQRGSGIDHDFLSGLEMACEGDLVDPRMFHHRGPRLAIAEHDVDDAIGDARLLSQFSQPQTSERRLLGRLHDDRTAGGQSWSPLPCGHQQRKIPGDDLADDADRLAARIAEIVSANRNRVPRELVGPAGVVADAVDGQRQVGGSRVDNRLAVVERFERGQLIEIRFHQIGELVHQAASIASIHLRPRTGFKRGSRGLHGSIDVGRIALGHFGDHCFIHRVDRLEPFAAAGLDPLAVDQHVGLTNFRGSKFGFSSRDHDWVSWDESERKLDTNKANKPNEHAPAASNAAGDWQQP